MGATLQNKVVLIKASEAKDSGVFWGNSRVFHEVEI